MLYTYIIYITVLGRTDFEPGLAPKNPTQKTQPKKPKKPKHEKTHLKWVFWVFSLFSRYFYCKSPCCLSKFVLEYFKTVLKYESCVKFLQFISLKLMHAFRPVLLSVSLILEERNSFIFNLHLIYFSNLKKSCCVGLGKA